MTTMMRADVEKRKQDWKEKLQTMSDEELHRAANQHIWLSAYASNNPRSDYHFMCDFVYDECQRRGKVNIYSEEHDKLVREAGG